MSKTWYDVKSQANASHLRLNIYDEIGGFGVNASSILNQIAAFDGQTITVDIDSPGGNAFDGLAIYRQLQRSNATVDTNIVGMAASSASLIYMAGDRREMPENSYVMIHNPWLVAAGDANQLEKYASDLRKFEGTYSDIYVNRTGMDKSEVDAMMNEETWLAGLAAQDMGIAHTVTPEVPIKALSETAKAMFNKLPDELSGNGLDLTAVTDIKSYEKALRDVGVSRSKAKRLATCAKSIFQCDAGVSDEAEQNAQYEQLVKLLQSFKVN